MVAADNQDNQHDVELETARKLFGQGKLSQAEILARRCLARAQGDPRALGLLDDLRRAYGISETFELSERSPAGKGRTGRFFLVRAQGRDFWSTAHSLVSQLLLAELTQRTPVIVWENGSLRPGDDDVDGFGRFFKEIPCARVQDIPASATIYPPACSLDDLRGEHAPHLQDAPPAAQYLFNRQETLVVGEPCPAPEAIIPWIGQSSDYYGLPADALYADLFQKYLRPAAEVAVKLDDVFFRNMQGRPWVGVHLDCEQSSGSESLLQSSIAGYTGFVDRIVALNPSIGVFLLTDSAPVRAAFRNAYGERLLCPAGSDCAAGGASPAGEGCLDLGSKLLGPLLALRCDYFVGNQASHLSLAIAGMRDWSPGFLFLLGDKNARSESPFLPPSPRKRSGARKKVMFYSDWHYGDVHMSRPYVVDLMEALGDCDFYYQHCNNPKLLADIRNLTYTRAKIAADVVIDTWIGQSHYRGMAVADFSTKEGVFRGCNFPHYHEVMREVYQRLDLLEFLKPVEYYLPSIDYSRFDIANIDRYFAGATGRHVLVCNNAIMSGQAAEVRFGELVPALAAAFPGVTFLISNNNGDLSPLPNVRYCTEIIDNPETVCDLNEISYISTFCELIVGRSSGPYSFSVTKENMQRSEFLCVCNDRRDTWYLETSTNISWTDNPSTEHLMLMAANLITETT
jgi:hypothetical protein